MIWNASWCRLCFALHGAPLCILSLSPPSTHDCSQRFLPKAIFNAKKARYDEGQRERKKLANVRAHSKPGSGAGIPRAERSKHLVGTVK
jgi:hypothetical protein